MASVSKRRWKKPDGSTAEAWMVRYLDPETGRRPGKTFDLKKDADAFKRKVEREIEDGTHITRRESRTFADAATAYLEATDARVAIGAIRPTTGQNIHTAMKSVTVPHLRGRLLIDITIEDLETWHREAVKTGKLSPFTATRRLWHLSRFFEHAIERGWAVRNPARAAAKAIGTPKQPEIETFALEDVRKLILAANDRRWRGKPRVRDELRLAVALAAFCGMRWGEIYGMTVHDVGEGAIQIRRSLDRLGNLQPPKTRAGNRTVLLPAHIEQLLGEFLQSYPSRNPNGIVFCTESGKPVTAPNFHSGSWRPLLARAGVANSEGKALRFHALRHFAVSWMIENGWPIPDVAKTVGHANVAMTLNVYAHVVKSKRQTSEAVQTLAERLLAGPEKLISGPVRALEMAT